MFLPVLSSLKLDYLPNLLFILQFRRLFSYRVIHTWKRGLQIYQHGPYG